MLPISTWNPSRQSNRSRIQYIDLGAIDNFEKRVTAHQEVAASEAPSRARQLVREGDVLVSTVRPNLNGVAIVPRELDGATASTGFCVLRANAANLDGRYLFHWVQTDVFVSGMMQRATGASYPAVLDSAVLESLMPTPPLPRQRRIAAILDEAAELRRKQRAALSSLDRLERVQFRALFGNPVMNDRGWDQVRFGDVLDRIESGWSPVCEDHPAAEGKWGVLKLNAITSGNYDYTANKELPPGIAPRAELEVRAGDLLFARKNTRDLVAAVALVRHTQPRLMLSDLIFRLKIKRAELLDSTFLRALLMDVAKRRQVQELAGGSAGSMPNISKSRLEGISIELPPISLQRAFRTFVVRLQDIGEAYRVRLEDLDLLWASLQRRAFSGAIETQ